MYLSTMRTGIRIPKIDIGWYEIADEAEHCKSVNFSVLSDPTLNHYLTTCSICFETNLAIH